MSDDDSGAGQPSRGSSGSLPALDTIRRAMRWETFAILAVLVLLGLIFT